MGRETLVHYDISAVINPREELLQEIFSSGSPLDKLNEIVQTAAPRYLIKGEESYLLARIGQTDKDAEIDLYWYSLKTLNSVMVQFRGKGLEDEDILSISLAETRELFSTYKEQEETFPYFKTALHHKVQRKLNEETANIYGLVAKDMPLIDIYFSSIKTFNELYGRDPLENELQEIINLELSRELSNEGNNELNEYSLARKRNIKRFEHIHNVRFEGDIFFEDSEMLLQEESTEEIYEQIELEEAINTKLEELPKVTKTPGGKVTEHEVIVRRFGFRSTDTQKETLDVAASNLGVSTERVRQVQETALSHLRSQGNRRQIRDYLADPDPSRRSNRIPRNNRPLISISKNMLTYEPELSGVKASEKSREYALGRHEFKKEDLLKRNWTPQILLEYLRSVNSKFPETLEVSGLPEVLELPEKWHMVFDDIRNSSGKGINLNAIVGASLPEQLPVITTFTTSKRMDSMSPAEQWDTIHQAAKPYYLDFRSGDIISPRPKTILNLGGYELLNMESEEPVGVCFEQLYRFLADYSPEQFTIKLNKSWNIMLLKGRDSKLLDLHGVYTNPKVVLTAWEQLLTENKRLFKTNKHLASPEIHNFAIYAGLTGKELKRVT